MKNYTECSTNHLNSELNGVFWELYHGSNKWTRHFSLAQYSRSANCGAYLNYFFYKPRITEHIEHNQRRYLSTC